MNASAIKPPTSDHLDADLRTLCRIWGTGYELAPGPTPDSLSIHTPDQGLVAVRIHGTELSFDAIGWPQVHERGFRRSYAQTLSVRVSAGREPEALARDVQRRLLTPYAAALAEARRRAADYRRLITDIGGSLDRAGLSASDRHVLGRTLQAQKPHGVLDDNGRRLPTTSTTTVTAGDDGAVASVEVRALSLTEAEALHGFINRLVAQRRPLLRLSA